MEKNQFPLEYIGYLQEKNNDLVDKLTNMKEMYEKKIFMKDMNRQYLLSLMKDALNVCTALPKEVDVFFEELSLAMDTLKNILLRKSEMTLLAEKISEAINPPTSRLEPQNPAAEIDSKHKNRKKGSAVKVSPMINGHVILTEPRIYLSRVTQNASISKKDSQPLSPIVEVSPCTSDSSTPQTHHYKQALSTPKRGRPPKKKKHSLNSKSPKSPLTQKSFSYENEGMQRKNERDPLEGPSWLLNDMQCFVNFRRRRRNFTERLERRNKKAEEEMMNGERKRKSTDHNSSNERTSFFIKDENEDSTRRLSISRTSRKKSDGRGSRRSGTSSSEYIEGTPPDSTINYKSKEQLLRDIATKQPMVEVEDCMTNKNLLKLIARSSCNANAKNTSHEKIGNKESTEDTNARYECETVEEEEICIEKNKEDIFSSEDFTGTRVGCKDGTGRVSESFNQVEGARGVADDVVNSAQGNVTNKMLNRAEKPDNDYGAKSNFSRKPSQESGTWRTEVIKIKSESPNSVEYMLSSGRSEEGNASDISTGSSTFGREPRQKRKAAPTNLIEPSLVTKLRRD